MRILTILLLSLLLAAPAFAAEYYVIASTPADVVAGANYAAHMQAIHGVSFTGATTEQLADDPGRFDGAMLTIIDGQEVTVVQGGADVSYVVTTMDYFTERGFDAGTALLAELYPQVAEGAEDVGGAEDAEDGPSATPPMPPVGEVPCDAGCRFGPECLAVGTRVQTRYCDGEGLVSQKADGEECADGYACASGECADGICVPAESWTPPDRHNPRAEAAEEEGGKGILARVWSWFRGLFGG